MIFQIFINKITDRLECHISEELKIILKAPFIIKLTNKSSNKKNM
jgi:hypothetical protein